MSTPLFDLDEIDALWQNRHQPEALAQLETKLAEVMRAAPREYSLLWRAARSFHFRAMQCDEGEDKEQERLYFSRGAEAARTATEIDSSEVEGCFWRGACELEVAQRTGKLAALATLKSSQAWIERAAKIDEPYHFAAPLRALGRIIHRKPLLLGGSAGVAIEYFKRALQLAPRNSTTQIYYAEALLTEQQKSEARRVLNEVLAAPEDASWIWEQARDRRIAARMLESMDAG